MAGEEQKAIASLEAKMDLLIKSVDEIKLYYVQKVQFEALEKRVEKLENAPYRWVNTAISAISAAVAVIAIIMKG
jgi:hypothetical protein